MVDPEAIGAWLLDWLAHWPEAPATRFLFTATEGVHGRELWITDGTAANTQLVKDVFPGPAGGLGDEILPLGDGRALLRAIGDTVQGFEPWVTDGTAAGTHWLTDILPGPNPTGPGPPTPPLGFVPLSPGCGLAAALQDWLLGSGLLG